MKELEKWLIENFPHIDKEEIKEFVEYIKKDKKELEKFIFGLCLGFFN